MSCKSVWNKHRSIILRARSIFFLNPVEKCFLLITKLLRIEILVASTSIIVTEILIAITRFHWAALAIWTVWAPWAGMFLGRRRRSERTGVILSWRRFDIPFFPLRQRWYFISIQGGRFGIVLLLYRHRIIVIWLTIQKLVSFLVTTNLISKLLALYSPLSFPHYRQIRTFCIPSSSPIQCPSIYPLKRNGQMISAHQGLDVCLNILNKSKFRMSQTPTVDCALHTRSISKLSN